MSPTSLANLLEPFGNRVVIAANAGRSGSARRPGTFRRHHRGRRRRRHAGRGARRQGAHVAVLLRGDRTPAATDIVLRWPVTSDALFRAAAIRSALAPAREKPEAPNCRRHRRGDLLDAGKIGGH